MGYCVGWLLLLLVTTVNTRLPPCCSSSATSLIVIMWQLSTPACHHVVLRQPLHLLLLCDNCQHPPATMLFFVSHFSYCYYVTTVNTRLPPCCSSSATSLIVIMWQLSTPACHHVVLRQPLHLLLLCDNCQHPPATMLFFVSHFTYCYYEQTFARHQDLSPFQTAKIIIIFLLLWFFILKNKIINPQNVTYEQISKVLKLPLHSHNTVSHGTECKSSLFTVTTPSVMGPNAKAPSSQSQHRQSWDRMQKLLGHLTSHTTLTGITII